MQSEDGAPSRNVIEMYPTGVKTRRTWAYDGGYTASGKKTKEPRPSSSHDEDGTALRHDRNTTAAEQDGDSGQIDLNDATPTENGALLSRLHQRANEKEKTICRSSLFRVWFAFVACGVAGLYGWYACVPIEDIISHAASN